jgi:ribosomal protein S18 acetylase RimI-like enzyme
VKSSYVDVKTRSIVSLDNTQHPDGLTVTRVSVLPQWRGRGIASRLLRECTEEADREGVVLWLAPAPDISGSGLTRAQLIAWYERVGFVAWSAPEPVWWRREPRDA